MISRLTSTEKKLKIMQNIILIRNGLYKSYNEMCQILL